MHVQKVYTDWHQLPILLDLGMVACVFGISYETAKSWAAKNKIPAQKVNGIWRVPKSALMEFLKEGESA